MAFDLTQPFGREALADKIAADIDEYCKVTYDDGQRRHLGASVTGHACMMYLWLTFRWACKATYIDSNGVDQKGRMMRLFRRGHWEEPHFVEWLRGTGWTITEFEPGTDDQIRIAFAEGHGGGSLDCETSHPVYTLGENFLGEFKTANEKQFLKMKKDFLRKSKPQHWGQMCQYGFKRKIKYGLYFMICKNDDKIHIEVLELDWRLGAELLQKGEAVITSQQPPPRISENPAWQDCKWCDKYKVCHLGEKVDVNCRSCRHAQPHKQGVWFCNFYQNIIPPEFIPKGCKDHLPIIGPQ